MITEEKTEVQDIKAEVLSFIEEQFVKETDFQVDYETDLLELGIIDSLSMMTLIMFIERKYELDFYEIDVERDMFRTIISIEQLVQANISG